MCLSSWIRLFLRTLVPALLVCASALAQAVLVPVRFVNVAADHWTAQFELINDGSLPEVSNFTVYFSWLYASNLQVLASPGTWDTITIEPDAALASDGFMDALVLDPPDALLPGQSLGGFEVGFDWDAAAAPPKSLGFVIYDASFTPIESGSTIPAGGVPLPLPSSLALCGLGVAALVVTSGRTVRRAGGIAAAPPAC